MAIIYNPNKKYLPCIRRITYQMADPLGYLLHLYYGEKQTVPWTMS